MSIVVLYSGWCKDAYRKRNSPEHELVFGAVVATDRLRSQVLEAAARCFDEILLRELRYRLRGKSRNLRNRFRALWLAPRRAADRPLTWLRIHPNTRFIIRYCGWQRGALIRNQQRIIGLKLVNK